ncbi:hypothetical protein NMK34_23810 [Micromonospora sp. BRA006-A]|uniref:hypothetical protein n=1 Tax=Micromonospora sp. BRA006-A TaxID=2962860 RepID=UPI00296E578D|nr:hypothetical protein [Micromonospora sp. BRA006-A]MDW3849644.1 hypothetical protein [Micromonospora sp. BRA006-A]
MRTRLIPGAAVLVALALTGCSGSDEPPAATPTTGSPAASASSRPPVDGGTFDSPLLLVEALNKGGVACKNYEAIAQPQGAVARGRCYVGADEYTIGIYASAADARAQPDFQAELLEGVSDVDMVLGRNWTVGCPGPTTCREVAEALGGEVFHEPA